MRVTGACNGTSDNDRHRPILSAQTPSEPSSVNHANEPWSPLHSQKREALAMLINRFVVQLQVGCGNSKCITPTCYTCKARVLPNRVRVYTTVTARAMAVELATSNHPDVYICPYVTNTQIAQASVATQQKTDPKSIVQQLFNTEAFRTFQAVHNSAEDTLAPSGSCGKCLLGLKVIPNCESKSSSELRRLTCDDMITTRTRQADTRYHLRRRPLSLKGTHPLSTEDEKLTKQMHNALSSLASFQTLSESFQDSPLREWDMSRQNDIPAVRLDQVFRGWSSGIQELIFDSLSFAITSLSRDARNTVLQDFFNNTDNALPRVANIAIHALTASIPRTQRDTWHVVWSTIVNGRAYGKQRYRLSDPYTSPWLHILDAFEFEPGHCLVDSLVRMIAIRRRAEDEAKMHDPSSHYCTLQESIITSLVAEEKTVRMTKFGSYERSELLHGQSLLGTTSLLWLEWLRKCFLKHWDGNLRLQRYEIAGTALELMEDIWKHQGISELDLPEDLFPIPVVFNNFNIDKVAVDWLNYQHEQGTRHIISFQNLFTTRAMTLLFRNVNHVLMRRAYCAAGAVHKMRTKAMPRSALGDTTYLDQRLKTAQEAYLVLKINRHSVLPDASDQIWHRTRSELAKPLRVRMGIDEGEIGHDLGGVQIEFFKLACAEALNPDYALFSVDPETRLAWFQPASMVPLYKYQLFGVLFALAVYNGVTLPVSFPLVFYRKLLGWPSEASDIDEAWPSQARSLRAICHYDGSVEDDLSRDYTFSFTANGLYVEVDIQDPWKDASASPKTSTAFEPGKLKIYHSYPDKYHPDSGRGSTGQSDIPTKGFLEANQKSTKPSTPSSGPQSFRWPGWVVEVADSEPPMAVTNANRAEYSIAYSLWLTDYSVRPQFSAFAEGFHTVLDSKSLKLLSPTNLRGLVEGHRTLDITLLQRAATYRGYDSKSQVITWFWEVVRSYPSETQKQLLEFVTASSRVPVNGADSLTFVIEKVLGDTGQLPGSSTCFSTLRLPEYESLDKLKEKLDIALQHSLGFGQA